MPTPTNSIDEELDRIIVEWGQQCYNHYGTQQNKNITLARLRTLIGKERLEELDRLIDRDVVKHDGQLARSVSVAKIQARKAQIIKDYELEGDKQS